MPDCPEPLTVAWVGAQAAAIAARRADDERAHRAEDRLHQTVLRAIADGRCADPAECARAALQTLELSFSRWYA